MKNINEINFADGFDDSDLIRLSNYIQTEFSYYGQFEYNNRDGLIEIIENYNMDINEIINLLFKNNNIKNNDEFLFYDSINKTLKSENRKDLFEYIMESIPKDLCNGEFKEIVEECLGYEITY